MSESEIPALLLLRVNPKKTTASTPLPNTSRPNENMMMKSGCHSIRPKSSSCAYSTVIFTDWSCLFVSRYEYKPKKVKTEHDKKAKKRKHEYEDDEEDEVIMFCKFTWWRHSQIFQAWMPSNVFLCLYFFKDIKPKKKTKDKKVTEGKKGKKEEEEKWKWWDNCGDK